MFIYLLNICLQLVLICFFRDGNEDVLLKLEVQSELSEKMLLRLIELKRVSYMVPTMDIFNPPNELKPLFCSWSKGLTISSAEFLSQVYVMSHI